MKKWKKLSEKLLFSHPRLTVYEDEVELPNGHRTQYLRFANDPDAACVLAINNEGKILVQKEYSYPPDEWLYQPPGGAIDKGETPLQGATRELAEEAGLKGDLEEIGWYYIANRRKDTKFYVFIARNLQDCPTNHDPEESFEDYWFTPEEITRMIRKGEIVNYAFLCAWALYTANL